MNKNWMFLCACFLALAGCGKPSVESAIEVKESVEINAPAAKVWALVGNYGDLGAWHPAFAKTEITSGENNVVGAKRLLTIKDGGTVNETLTALDNKAMTMTYIITESVLPLRDYTATLKVDAKGDNQSVVTWSSSFKRKDPNDPPKAGEDDKTARDLITNVFKDGLANLKQLTEK